MQALLSSGEPTFEAALRAGPGFGAAAIEGRCRAWVERLAAAKGSGRR